MVIQIPLSRRACSVRACSIYVPAGGTAPLFDSLTEEIDLIDALGLNTDTTCLFRVHGDSMTEAGIEDGDLLAVDCACSARTGDTIVAVVNGEFTVKRLDHQSRQLRLVPANDAYRPITVRRNDDFRVWGVVRHVIKRLR